MLRNTQVPQSEIGAAMGFAADFLTVPNFDSNSRLCSVNAQKFDSSRVNSETEAIA
jgi:hypothetical protein